jgi:hypothetical protein
MTTIDNLSASRLPPASSLLGSENFNPDAMTPDSLLIYLSTRMGSLDGQMGDIFNRQKTAEKVRTDLRGIQEALTKVPTNTDETKLLEDLSPEVIDEINAHLNNIEAIDPKLGADIRAHLRADGQILSRDDDRYFTSELKATQDYLNLVGKDLESGSQMDMITLQSLMGARQTAIQLSTNLISALNESQKSIVANVR